MTGHVWMPSMAHVGISLPHPLTFSGSGLASSRAGADPTVHLLGCCTWSARRGWRKSTESCEWLFTDGSAYWETLVRLFCCQAAFSPSRVLPPVFHTFWSKLSPPPTRATLLPASAAKVGLNAPDWRHQYEHLSLNFPAPLILTSIFSSLFKKKIIYF